ncbi:MAG: sigma-70 family RNA polymerase sigma factor [Ruminococcus sp.]|uniref:sigma-70 family RNA polymerase sigma factor n=1 Tax=Ruminococcus sp. TaxID=41978 RepID=UPI002873CDAE|nr:sigma-70 family RNA polymerase sigma factor [Ruminococcus sp.]MBQ3285290.1 sigma-70 family RNA polymerase sigma factor [Ruminococcus sp.]
MRCYILNDVSSDCKNRLSDEELIQAFLSGDDEAFEAIVSRYLGLISTVARKYRGMSSDIDDNDMIQEGMVALLSACRSFDANKGMSFKNYLILCVENRYRTMLRACARQRAVPARNMLSLEDEADTAVDPTETSLPEMIESKDYIDSLHRILKDSLSDLEYKVAILHLSGYSYKEIAQRLNIPLKSVDNAQTRIRQKLSR